MPGSLVEWRVHCLFFLFLFQRARSNPSLQLPSHSDGPGPAPPNLPWNSHDAQQRPFGPITVHPWTGPGRTNWPWCHGGKWPALMFFFYIYFNIFYLFLLNEIFTHPLHDRHRLLGNREVLTLPNLRKWIVKNCRRKELKSERMNNLNKLVSF